MTIMGDPLNRLGHIQMYDKDTSIHLNNKRVDVSCSFGEIANQERSQENNLKRKLQTTLVLLIHIYLSTNPNHEVC